MSFSGFDRIALDRLAQLPELDAEAYASLAPALKRGLVEPAFALLQGVVAELDEPLTVARRSSVSPLHADLRFAAPGAPRYKDHLLLTAWHGPDKKTGPTLWVRIDAGSIGFASGVGFTPAVRQRWRKAVGGLSGERLAAAIAAVRAAHVRHEVEVAGPALKKVPAPFDADHPRAELLKLNGFQLRFREKRTRAFESPALVSLVAERWRELLPVHRWLVAELIEGGGR